MCSYKKHAETTTTETIAATKEPRPCLPTVTALDVCVALGAAAETLALLAALAAVGEEVDGMLLVKEGPEDPEPDDEPEPADGEEPEEDPEPDEEDPEPGLEPEEPEEPELPEPAGGGAVPGLPTTGGGAVPALPATGGGPEEEPDWLQYAFAEVWLKFPMEALLHFEAAQEYTVSRVAQKVVVSVGTHGFAHAEKRTESEGDWVVWAIAGVVRREDRETAERATRGRMLLIMLA
jgi:hypothetical protein